MQYYKVFQCTVYEAAVHKQESTLNKDEHSSEIMGISEERGANSIYTC